MRSKYVVLLLRGMSDIVILCQYLSCRSFSASTLILTGDWLNTYLPSCKSARDDFHCPFHFTVQGTPANRIHPVIGSIIYPRCLRIEGASPDKINWLDSWVAAITSGVYPQACFIRWVWLHHPIQGQYTLWQQICFTSHYHLSFLEFWDATSPVEIL